MNSNAISETEFTYITEIIPKMYLIDTKTVHSTANVFNKMESKTIDTERINMLLSITPVYRKKSMKYAFQDTFVFR